MFTNEPEFPQESPRESTNSTSHSTPKKRPCNTEANTSNFNELEEYGVLRFEEVRELFAKMSKRRPRVAFGFTVRDEDEEEFYRWLDSRKNIESN